MPSITLGSVAQHAQPRSEVANWTVLPILAEAAQKFRPYLAVINLLSEERV
jgi:hypothetical protein